MRSDVVETKLTFYIHAVSNFALLCLRQLLLLFLSFLLLNDIWFRLLLFHVRKQGRSEYLLNAEFQSVVELFFSRSFT